MHSLFESRRGSAIISVVGGHLMHLLHWLVEETEKGGIFAGVGIALGLLVGYQAQPVMHPSESCESTGLGRDVFGRCPDLFDGERLIFVLMVAVVFGALGIVVGYLVTGGNTAE